MTKSALFSLVFILATVKLGRAQTTKRLYVGDFMNQKVRRVTETRYLISKKRNGDEIDDPVGMDVMEFDEQGNMVSFIDYFPVKRDGAKVFVIFHRHTYKYYTDAAGQKYVDAYQDSLKVSVGKINNEGRIISVDYVDKKNRVCYTDSHRYSDSNTVHTSSLFDLKGVLKTTVIYHYNKDGHIITMTSTDNKGNVTYESNYKYLTFDSETNWTKSTGAHIRGHKTEEFGAERVYIYYP